MRIGVTIFTMLACVLTIGLSAYCDDSYSEDDLRIFDGKVVSVDVKKSTITVKSALEMTFTVSKDTQLIDDIYDIELSDLRIGNYVTVEYVTDPDGPKKVLSITKDYGNDNE